MWSEIKNFVSKIDGVEIAQGILIGIGIAVFVGILTFIWKKIHSASDKPSIQFNNHYHLYYDGGQPEVMTEPTPEEEGKS